MVTTSGISPSFLGLSRSSGQVTHVLLTRSRLCPRPKPGSSLHLHVLGTPPAFVLSQDQTLREELPAGDKSPTITKSRQGDSAHEGLKNLGPVPGGIRPLRSHEESSMYTVSSRSARRGQFWHRRPGSRGSIERAMASNLDTLLDRGVDRGCACC